jgi:hypothetical protein
LGSRKFHFYLARSVANVKELRHLEAGFTSPGISMYFKIITMPQRNEGHFISVRLNCVLGLPGMGPYRRSASPFGGAGHARDCIAVFFM